MKKILALGGIALVAVLVFVFINSNQNPDTNTQTTTNNTQQESNQALESPGLNEANPIESAFSAITSDLTAETAIASEAEVASSDFIAEENETSNINSFYDPNNF